VEDCGDAGRHLHPLRVAHHLPADFH
jgi:hypothetical protein